MGRPSNPIDHFKNWLAKQEDMSDFFDIKIEEHEVDHVGKTAHAKVSQHKLLQRIESVDGAEPEDLIQELIEQGGSVIGIEGKYLVIEVESGTFQIPKFCVKLSD